MPNFAHVDIPELSQAEVESLAIYGDGTITSESKGFIFSSDSKNAKLGANLNKENLDKKLKRR